MIEIIDDVIIRDGTNIGVIENGIAYVYEKQAPRIVGQIRSAYGNPDLVVEIGSPTSEDSLPVANHEEIGVTVDIPDSVPNETQFENEQVDQPSLPLPSFDTTGFPDPNSDPCKFRICFVNNYGNDAFSQWQKNNL